MRSTYHSDKQEKRWASRLDGRVSPGSGASVRCKSDVTCEFFKVECKTTTKDSYPLKHTTLIKIEKEAKKVAKHFMLTVEFTNHKQELVIVDRNLSGILRDAELEIVSCENLQHQLEPLTYDNVAWYNSVWTLKFGDREYLVFEANKFELIFDSWLTE